MTSYTITNAAGATVATINPATTTGVSFPIELTGQGFSLYGQTQNQNMYRMLENFAKSTPPSNPLVGQFWYDSVNANPFYWNGTTWVQLATGANSMVRFKMAAGSINIDFGTLGSTVIFTHPGTAVKYYPMSILFVPKSVVSVSTPAGFNLSNLVTEDVLETTLITNPSTTKSGMFMISGMVEPVTIGNSITLNVTSAATGGGGFQLKYDALMFGLVR